MKLSIIVPAFNCEKYMARCLQSLLQEKVNDTEIICIDDGSTDSTRKICDFYSEKYPCIKVMRQDNMGASTARNKGIEAAKGKYICFVDADDWIEQGMIQESVRRMEEDETIDLCISDAVRSYPDGSEKRMFETAPIQFFSAEEALNKMISERIFFWYLWGKVYKRSVLADCRIDEHIITSEDLDLNWKIFMSGKVRKVLYAPTYKYYYYMNSTSITEAAKIAERRISDLSVYTNILRQEPQFLMGFLKDRMYLYSLHAVYDILRDLCFRGEDDNRIFQYLKKGREILHKWDGECEKDKGFVCKMREILVSVPDVKNYFFDVFESVRNVIKDIDAFVSLYIYGTGTVAKYVSVIVKSQREYQGYVISDGQPNVMIFQGKKVYHWSDLPAGKKKILLALNPLNRQAVLKQIKDIHVETEAEMISLEIPNEF